MDAEDFGRALRILLARPLLLRSEEAESFRLIATQRRDLREWFESNLGWRLYIDLPGGIARLHKRSLAKDPRRGLRRVSGSKRAFDPLRYQLLCLVCAELLRRPHQTMGDLADTIEQVTASDEQLANFDTTRHVHRLAFVDVLVWMQERGVIEATAGRFEAFSSTEKSDAVLRARTHLIPQLLSCETPPSRVASLAQAHTPDEWIEALSKERRDTHFEQEPQSMDQSQRNLRARHRILRRLVDDPVMDLKELSAPELHYLQSPSGREKIMKALAKAGFICERHTDTWLAIDPSLESSDVPALFGMRPSVVQQVACLLLMKLVDVDKRGSRVGLPRSVEALESDLASHMERNPKWGRAARKAGVELSCREALERLAEFGLVLIRDAQVFPRPAAARYSVELGEMKDE